MNILLIDDEPDLCSCIASFLEGKGHKVVSLTEAKDVKQMDLSQFEAVVVDLNLGSMTGIEVLTYAREKNKTIKTILMSGGDAPASDVYDFFLEKPGSIFTIDEMLAQA